jgi:hypothetical protein
MMMTMSILMMMSVMNITMPMARAPIVLSSCDSVNGCLHDDNTEIDDGDARDYDNILGGNDQDEDDSDYHDANVGGDERDN